MIERDREGRFSREAWQKCAELGVLGLPIPEEYGGAGADALTTFTALEGARLRVRGQRVSCSRSTRRSGRARRRSSVSGRRSRSRRTCPGSATARSSPLTAMTRAGLGLGCVRALDPGDADDGGYRAQRVEDVRAPTRPTPTCSWSSRPPTDRRLRRPLRVPRRRDTPGPQRRLTCHKMGLRTSPMSEVFLQDCEVPARTAARPARRRDGGVQPLDGVGAELHPRELRGDDGAPARALGRLRARSGSSSESRSASFQAIAAPLVDMKVRARDRPPAALPARLASRPGQARGRSNAAMTKLYLARASSSRASTRSRSTAATAT